MKGRLRNDEDRPVGEPEGIMEYRHCVAAANRPDLGYVVKELSHSRQKPTEGEWARLRQSARYLEGSMEVGTHFRRSDERMVATCSRTSVGPETSLPARVGGLLMFMKCCLLFDGARA